MEVKTLPTRDSIKVEDTWRLEDIFKTDDDWEASFQHVKKLYQEMSQYVGTLKNGGKQLLLVLKKKDEVMYEVEKLYSYAHMRYDQDTTNSFYQGFNDRIKGLYAMVCQSVAFVLPEILALDEKTIEKFMEEEPQLKEYAHMLDEIQRKRPHVLSVEQESLLAEASEVLDASSDTFSMLNNADLVFPSITDENGVKVEVTHGRFTKFLQSPNRQVRKDAFDAVYDTYGSLRNTFASTLSGTVKNHQLNARVRKYNSARHASLAQNNIPEEVYDQLVSTIHKYLPLLHRYVELRKKVLGVDELHMYDLYTPLVPEVDMKISYEQAKGIMFEALKPMGDDYLAIIKEGFDNRWVDLHETKGKRSGAYSSGCYGTNPYILMNWQDNIENLFTLIHEFGHSVHSYLTRKHQPYHYGDYSIFLAEVASTCNERLLNDYLLRTETDPARRLYDLNYFLEGFRTTVFRQTMFAEFEQKIHQRVAEGEALTADWLEKTYYDLNVLYYGTEHMCVDKKIGLEWARIPHFYYNFYVYQYATGYSAAIALSKQILTEGAPAVERYIEYLKAGCSDYPIDVLKRAGVDMTTSAPIEAACKVFEEKLIEMEKMLV